MTQLGSKIRNCSGGSTTEKPFLATKVWDEHNEPSKSKTVTLIPLWPKNRYWLCALFIFHFLVDDFFREIAVDWLNLCTISVTFWRFAIFFTVSGHRPHQHTCQYEKKLLAKEFWLIVCTYTNILLFNGYNNLHEIFADILIQK